MLSGDRAMFFSRAHVLLVGAMAAAAFWSTALVEIASLLLILLFVAGKVFEEKHFRPSSEYRREVRLKRASLILVGLYVTAVLTSIALSGTPFVSFAGLAWHPLLFVVMLYTPMKETECAVIGTVFFASAAGAAGTTLLINMWQAASLPRYALTGLTTFADLLVLAAIVGIALFFGMSGRNRRALSIAMSELLVVFTLFWTSERAPVAVLAVAGGTLIALVRPRLLLAWVFLLGGLFALGPLTLRLKFDWLVHLNPLDRYVVWEEGLRQLGHVPLFGHGPDSYAHVLPSEAWGKFHNRPPDSWHNDLLQIFLDNGPIAAATIAGLLGLTLRGAVRAFARRRAGRDYMVSSYPGILVFILVLLGMVGSVITTAILGAVFWVLLGMTMQAACRETDDHP